METNSSNDYKDETITGVINEENDSQDDKNVLKVKVRIQTKASPMLPPGF